MEPKRKRAHEISYHEPDIPLHKRRELERNEKTKLTHRQYTVGWICAIPTEYAAAKALLDEEHSHPHNLPQKDGNHYTFGRIGPHNVVMTVLPGLGKVAAATVATNMQHSFPRLEIRLMVGIGGGAPTRINDIRLGDVVVSTTHDGHGSVFQYDFGKDIQGQGFHQTGFLDQPPQHLLGAVAGLRTRYLNGGHHIEETVDDVLRRMPNLGSKFARPRSDSDKLYRSTFVHPRNSTETCAAVCQQDFSNVVERSPRTGDNLVVHYGVIASADQVMKNAETRDKIAAEHHVLCFEMEAAGLSNTFPCLVIRGICDYSDSHKNKEWQGYAALTAAAYAKDLLYELTPLCPPSPVLTSTESQDPKAAADRERLVDERRKQLLDSLSFDQIDARQMTIKKAHAKTCKWVLKSSEYLDWLDHTKRKDHHGFLWVKGKPGTGKSTLMKFVSGNYRKTMRKGTLITFFFNARGEQLEKSTTGMYRSLLLQLVEALPQLRTVLDFPALMTPSTKPFEWTIEFLKELLEEVFQNLQDESVTCFIDALDECDEDQIRDMVKFFEKVSETTTTMNIGFQVCFSSRHYPHITISKAVSLILEGQEGHKDDIVKYVLCELRIGTSKTAQLVRSELQEKASGVFMWVILVVDILNKEYDGGRMHRLRQRLRELPGDLDTLFRDILFRDRHRRDELLLSIQWILFAWDPEVITADVMVRFILNASKGLAEVTKSFFPTVQFIHESVRDFLLKVDGLSQIWPEFNGNFHGQCHERLKVCCLNYLAVATALGIGKDIPTASPDQADKLRKSTEGKLPFIKYATQQVLHHSDLAEQSGVSQVDFLQTFDVAGWTALNNLFEKHEVRRYKPQVSLLYILAEQNRVNLVKTSRSKLDCLRVEAERYGTPIFSAIATGSFETVHAFLVALKEANPNSLALSDLEMKYSPENTALYERSHTFSFSTGRSILSNVVELGHVKIAAFIIERDGVEVDSEEGPKLRTPLSYAAEKGMLAMVRLLFESGKVDLERKDKDGMTPLAHAAKNGHDSVVKMLLETGQVDPDNADRDGRTPFCHACRYGHDSVVKRLLDTGRVDPDHTDKDGMTHLAHTAKNGHNSVVKMLLETGQVDPDHADKGGLTPFCHACRHGHEAVAERLLGTGRIDSNHQPEGGLMPFWDAVIRVRETVVRLFLESDHVKPYGENELGKKQLLYVAIRSPYSDILRLLLVSSKVDLNFQDASGRTPLSHAAGHAAIKNVKVLLDSDHVEADSKDNLGRTPLSHAATASPSLSSDITHTIKLLLGNNRVNIDSKDNSGRTPLSHAAGYSNLHAVSALVKAGAHLTLGDKSGWTPLDHATKGEHQWHLNTDESCRLIDLLKGGAYIP